MYLGNTEVFCHLVAGLGHQERPGLVQEPDGPDLVVLVHQGHGLAHQGHRLLDQLLQQIIDVDDFLRFLLLGFAGGDQIVDRALHHQQLGDVVVDGQNGGDLALAVTDIDCGGFEDLAVRRPGQVAKWSRGAGSLVVSCSTTT